MKPAILYDADCGFCRWSLKWVRKWDRRGAVRSLPIQSPEGARLLSGVPEQRWLESWHLVQPDGRVHSAGAAFPPLLRVLPGGRVPARICELMPITTGRMYRLVTGNRHRLGRLVRRFGTVPTEPPLS